MAKQSKSGMQIRLSVSVIVGFVLVQVTGIALSTLLFATGEGNARYLWIGVVAAVACAIDIAMLLYIHRDFYRSVGTITKENFSIRLSLKNARLSAMVSQLNPHFLFNTLQMLQNEIVNGTRETSNSIVISMSNLFRYSSLNTEAIIKLADEIKFISDYLSICEHVYEENLKVDIRMEKTLYEYMIPKFMLQPIVENCIKHGFGNAPYRNQIRITGLLSGDALLLCVVDDGRGMDAQSLQSVRTYIQSTDNVSENMGIGLKNVHQRIKLLFGQQYGLSIESNPEEGTTVTLRLPCIDSGSTQS